MLSLVKNNTLCGCYNFIICSNRDVFTSLAYICLFLIFEFNLFSFNILHDFFRLKLFGSLPLPLLHSILFQFLREVNISRFKLFESVFNFRVAFLVLVRLGEVVVVHSSHRAMAILAVEAGVGALVHEVRFQFRNGLESASSAIYIRAW